MNISSVSSTSNSSYTSGNDSDLKQLLNRSKLLESQIEAETQSIDNAKTKQEKIELLQAQIVQIQTQIQAKKSTQTSNSVQETKTITSLSDNKINIKA